MIMRAAARVIVSPVNIVSRARVSPVQLAALPTVCQWDTMIDMDMVTVVLVLDLILILTYPVHHFSMLYTTLTPETNNLAPKYVKQIDL